MTKHIRALLAAFLLLASMASPALAKDMSVEQAQKAAKKLFKDFPFEVISVKQSAVKGLWEASLILEGRYRILYLDNSGNIAILPGAETQGHMIDLNRMASLTNEATQKLGIIDFSTLPLKDAIVMGSKKAKIQVAVFDDPY